MKRKTIIIGIILLLIAIFFFPVKTVRTISGPGEILNRQKEKTGDCQLSIAIEELNARTFSYKKQFTFFVDGVAMAELPKGAHHETHDAGVFFGPGAPVAVEAGDKIAWISEGVYDAEENGVVFCQLVYQTDLSFAVVSWKGQFYFIDNGANIPRQALPVEYVPADQ
mgnify:FL=1